MTDKMTSLVNDLGEELRESAEVREYLAARDAYAADRAISEKVAEYNVQRMVYEQESAKDEKDTLLLDQIQKRMDVKDAATTENDVMKRYVAAEDGVNTLFGEINRILQSFVIPEEEHSCGGDCGHCGGCH